MADDQKTVMVIGGFAESLVNFRGPLLQAMIERGFRVIACAPSAPSSVKQSLETMGCEYVDVSFDRAGINPIHDLISFLMLWRVFRRLKPDIVLGYTIKPVIYGSLAAKLAGVKECYSMITGLGYAFVGRSYKRCVIRRLVQFLYRCSLGVNQKVFFQNPDDLELFVQLGILQNKQQAVLVNGSGVDVDSFTVLPFPQRITFLLIARFLKDKGIMEYLEAARIIKEKHLAVQFRIVGWVDDNPAAISMEVLAAYERDGSVENLGKVADVRPAIADASVYVLPSYREGTPRTVLEAMAMGRPIITTDAPGCRETVAVGLNGYLVALKSVASLVQAMERFIDDPDQIASMGGASRLLAEQKYDVRNVNQVILQTMNLIK